MTMKQLERAIKAQQKMLAKTRDMLRDLEHEAAQLKDDASEAIDLLEAAADRLSELQ